MAQVVARRVSVERRRLRRPCLSTAGRNMLSLLQRARWWIRVRGGKRWWQNPQSDKKDLPPGLRKKSLSGNKDAAQWLKPNVFSIVYGPTKSRALIQNRVFSQPVKAASCLIQNRVFPQPVKPDVFPIAYG